MKTSELTGQALDYAVAKCEGGTNLRFDTVATYWVTLDGKDRALSKGWAQSFTPSTNWAQGGPIIKQERIAIDVEHGDLWRARFGRARITFDGRAHHYHHQEGSTPLIAAMRCYVSSKLGDEVDIPKELLNV